MADPRLCPRPRILRQSFLRCVLGGEDGYGSSNTRHESRFDVNSLFVVQIIESGDEGSESDDDDVLPPAPSDPPPAS